MEPAYSTVEMMAVVAAREVRDREAIFAGTGLPILVAALAQRTHAPDCMIVFEAGGVGPKLRHLPMSVGDSRSLSGAVQAAGLFEIFSYVLQREPYLASFHPDASVDEVRSETGFELDCDDAIETPPPSAAELEALRADVDPERIFLC